MLKVLNFGGRIPWWKLKTEIHAILAHDFYTGMRILGGSCRAFFPIIFRVRDRELPDGVKRQRIFKVHEIADRHSSSQQTVQ